MATSALPQASDRSRMAMDAHGAALAAYGLGAVGLVAEAVVHVQQFISLFSGVRWIGPLFLLNAVAILVVLAGLAYARTRVAAAVAGLTISALALGALIISYGTGLFGWQEAGFRTPIAIAMIAEVVAVISLAVGLAASTMDRSR
jgi:hypothetical protein